MKFSQRLSIREKFDEGILLESVWTPKMETWRDLVEDYLYISRKRMDNKLALFRLQLSILADLVDNSKLVDKYKDALSELEERTNRGDIDEPTYKREKENIERDSFSIKIFSKAMREIIDGIVWRIFNYNRAILYILADKAPIEVLRPDQGLLKSLFEFGDIFLDPHCSAIFNDISNFLRVGDITKIDKDGNIELIEVKSSKRRGGRITRQKQRMIELVDFFNTGIGEYDGNRVQIRNSKVKQRNYLKLLLDYIRKAQYKGYESALLGNHMIVQIADYKKVKDPDMMIQYFQSKHGSVQDQWEANGDFVLSGFFVDKLEYSRNYVPFSIFPYDNALCADIMTGQLAIFSHLNYSEVIRTIKKAGWEIIDSIFNKTEKEILELDQIKAKDYLFLRLRKPPLTFDVPPTWFGRLHFELLSPKVIIDELDEVYNSGQSSGQYMSIVNYLDEQNIWD